MTPVVIAAGTGLLAVCLAIRLARRRKRRTRLPKQVERYRQPNSRYDHFR